MNNRNQENNSAQGQGEAKDNNKTEQEKSSRSGEDSGRS